MVGNLVIDVLRNIPSMTFRIFTLISPIPFLLSLLARTTDPALNIVSVSISSRFSPGLVRPSRQCYATLQAYARTRRQRIPPAAPMEPLFRAYHRRPLPPRTREADTVPCRMNSRRRLTDCPCRRLCNRISVCLTSGRMALKY